MIKGAFPPSSRATLFKDFPHKEYRVLPTSQEPVNDTIDTLIIGIGILTFLI